MRTLGCALALALPATAAADGLPVGGIDAGPAGIAIPGQAARYVTLNTGRDTVFARVAGGAVIRHTVVPGTWTLPAVALDGTPDGLAANTLVVLRPRRSFPQRVTRFAVLDVPRLRVRRRITLRGDYSFDAIAPDGRTAFVVHYTSRTDPTLYEVQPLDLRTGRLGAVMVDKTEPGEQMRGYPISRVTSPDRRWVYTYYDGAGHHPFIHAIDTVDEVTRCIDLDELEHRDDLTRLELELGLGGRTVTVKGPTGPLVTLDTTSWEPASPIAWLGSWLGGSARV